MTGKSGTGSNGNRARSRASVGPDQSAVSLQAEGKTERPVHVPSGDEIKSELWRIAIGDGSESSRVSALRALADIMGLTKAQPLEFPPAMKILLDALEEGFENES